MLRYEIPANERATRRVFLRIPIGTPSASVSPHLSVQLRRRYAGEGRMAALEGRVGNRMQEQSQAISDLRNDVARLETKLVDSFARLDDKISRQFIWLVGMLVTVLAAVVGGLLSR